MNILYSLNHDIMDLYFRTGNKSIENLFIKAETQLLDFHQWILKPRYKIFKDVDFSDDYILPTFAQMNKLMEMYPTGIQVGTVAQLMFDPSFSKFIPKIKSIGKYANQFGILKYYSPIFDSLKTMTVDNKDDANTLRDLQIILAKYDSYQEELIQQTNAKENFKRPDKETIFQFRSRMYSELMKHFSLELSQEALRQGKKELADLFNEGGISNIYKLSELFKIYGFGEYKMMGFSLDAIAKDILKYVWAHYSANDIESNIVYIKSKALDAGDLIPFTDYHSVLETRKRAVKKSLGQEVNEVDDSGSVIHNPSLMFNMKTMSCLAMFFFLYTKELELHK